MFGTGDHAPENDAAKDNNMPRESVVSRLMPFLPFFLLALILTGCQSSEVFS